jgi:hypothetical protein
LPPDALVVDEDNGMRLDWRIARIGSVVPFEKPPDDRSPKRMTERRIEAEQISPSFVDLC